MQNQMKEIKSVVVMNFGKTFINDYYPKGSKVKFPKEAPIYDDWDKQKLLGIARNFKLTKHKIIADILLNEFIFDTVVPAITFKDEKKKNKIIATKCEVGYLSLVDRPADKTLKGNLTKKTRGN